MQIIDLGGRRILEIDPQKRSYTEITFDEMKAAMQRTQERAQQKQDSEVKPESKPATDSKADPKANINAKVTMTPGTASRQIQGLTANEMKMQIDMVIQAQRQNGQTTQANAANSGLPPVSIRGSRRRFPVTRKSRIFISAWPRKSDGYLRAIFG